MSYLAIINTPGYLPDSEPEEYDTAQEAWQALYESRMSMEEDSYPGEDYTDGVLVLAFLAGQDSVNAGRQKPITVHMARDRQVTGYQLGSLEPDGGAPLGWVRLRTQLPGDDSFDTDLGEVYEVRENDRITE